MSPPSLPRVGRRLRHGLLVVVVVLAGAATAMGVSSAREPEERRAGTAPTSHRPALAPASATPTPSTGLSRSRKEKERRRARRPRRGGAAYYRRTASAHVPASVASDFLPLYREAERTFGVSWLLIASVHRQETAFSTAPGIYHGLNAFGCCAGPMQFNVTNGPPSTWKLYRHAFKEGRRPARYPNRTDFHPSVYDDFDAIMAAGALLSDSGAGRSLDAGAWQAAYGYYGHDLFGVTYANQVLARAVAWERDGFCLNCALDEDLVAEFEDAYGESARRELAAAERKRKRDKQRARARKRERERREARRRRAERRADGRARDRSPAEERRRSPSPPASKENPPPATTTAPPPETQPSTTPTTPAPSPSGDDCTGVHKLLGC